MSGEFDGAPLVAGTVRGVRRFRVDELGRLRSPQQGTVWRPGDNEARCVKQDGIAFAAASLSITIGGGYPVPRQPKESRPLDRPGHDVASCRCGFYAYSDGHDAAEYGGPGTVTAVVEGWGDVMVGTRGFRAPHARVLAVHVPGKSGKVYGPKRPSEPVARLAYRISPGEPYDFPWWLPTGVLAVIVLTLGIATWSVAGPFIQSAGPYVVLLALGLAFCAVELYRGQDRKFDDELSNRYRERLADPPSAASVDALRANYPDVEFYGSYGAMVAAFPPSPGEKPTPANTPDFWERP